MMYEEQVDEDAVDAAFEGAYEAARAEALAAELAAREDELAAYYADTGGAQRRRADELSRRGERNLLVRLRARTARRRYASRTVGVNVTGMTGASNKDMNRQELIAAIHQSLEQGRLDNARRLAGEARAWGITDVADRTFAAIEKLAPRAPRIAGAVPTTLREGLYTVADDTGHVTFKVSKQDADEKFAPGETIIGRLIGSDNTSDYLGVAFWKADGRVILWKKHRGDVRLEAAIRVLVGDPKAAALRYAQASGRCYVCGRTLTSPESISEGIGPVCREKGY